MRRIVICLIFALQLSVAVGQSLSGVVSDMKTNEPLAYVHIGVAGRNLGVISRDDGSFEIDISRATQTDKLVFSIIGYETKRFDVGDLKSGRMDVKLMGKIYQLKEVVVKPGERAVAKLGRIEPTKVTTGQTGQKEFGFGGEWGLRIFHNGKRYFINDVRLHLRYNTVDSILFRINLYNVIDSMPDESILHREIFMTAREGKHWIIEDLVKENITMDRDLIITFEVVRVWFSKRGENMILFTHGKGYDEGRSYFRPSSQSPWTIDQQPPATLYLTAEEY